jgi:hypothetical protein
MFMTTMLLHRCASYFSRSRTRVQGSSSRLLSGTAGRAFEKHVVLDEGALRENVCIVGDVHGCLDELKDLLEKVWALKGRERTSVIFAGDLVNKGPYSAEVVAYARNLEGAHCVRGNHDDYVIKRGESGFTAQPWEAKLTPEDHDYLRQLPFTIRLPWLNAMVVHAGIVPNKDLSEQRDFDMMMMRNVVDKDGEATAAAAGGELKALAHENEGEAWAAVWDEMCRKKELSGETPAPPHIYFGHDAKRLLQRYEYATGLDTGCCYGKELTAVVLPGREFVQVKAREVYEVPGGGKK